MAESRVRHRIVLSCHWGCLLEVLTWPEAESSLGSLLRPSGGFHPPEPIPQRPHILTAHTAPQASVCEVGARDVQSRLKHSLQALLGSGSRSPRPVSYPSSAPAAGARETGPQQGSCSAHRWTVHAHTPKHASVDTCACACVCTYAYMYKCPHDTQSAHIHKGKCVVTCLHTYLHSQAHRCSRVHAPRIHTATHPSSLQQEACCKPGV